MGQTLSVNQLVDMEWRFGVTASSNEAQRVGSSFLQLRLLVNKGNANEEVFMGRLGRSPILSHTSSNLLVVVVCHLSPLSLSRRTDSTAVLLVPARNGES